MSRIRPITAASALGLAHPQPRVVAEAGGHQRRRQHLGTSEHRIGSSSRKAPPPRAGVERLAEGGHVHDAGEEAVAVLGGDRHGVAGQAVEEVRGAVDGVDQPLDAARAGTVGALLADDGVVGARRLAGRRR